MKCLENCEAGWVERDVSHGDWAGTELLRCPFCVDGEALCVSCNAVPATKLDDGEPVCEGCV